MRTPFDDAVAVWHLGDLRNGNGADHSSSEVRSAHPLATHGSVQVGVALSGAERQESLRRGGDGRAALFDGDAWLSTGPATGGVDLSAESFTTCVRLRADKPGGVFYTNLLALLIHGDDRGEGLLVAHLGVCSGESALYREVLLGTVRLGVWHDLIVRYRRRDPGGADGGELSLACDGRIVWLVEIGEHPRAIFAGPTIIGGWRVADPPLPEFPMEIVDGIFRRLFAGAIDHAAFWNRALDDREVAELSGVAALEEVAAEDGAGHDASPAAKALAQYNAFYDASRARDVERCRELGREMRRHMARDARRPIYHLTAPMGFIQDPCSAFYHDGRYHVFSFRNILVSLSCTHLDHYVSDDLIHWQDMPVACWADSDYDVYGIWLTNNVIDDDGLPAMLYTAHGMRGKIGVLSRSTDGMVSFGDKRAVITNRIHHDGHTWRTDSEGADRWVTLTTDQYFGARPGDRADRIVALTSPDLEHWTERGEVWSVTKHPDPQDSPQRWGLTEFPYIVPFGNRDALIAGNRPVVYWVGVFDRERLRFTPDDPEPKLIDYGNPVHCCNPLIVDRKGPGGAPRRIILAEHGHAHGAVGGAPWHGLHVLPRVLSLHDDRLVQEPAREVEALRGRHVATRGLPVAAGAAGLLSGIEGDALEIVCTFDPGSADRFGLLVRLAADRGSCARVFYEVATDRFGVDGAVISSPYREQRQGPAHLSGGAYLRRGDPVTMRLFLDRCLLEVFVNGHACSMVLAAGTGDRGLDLFSDGGTATVRSLDIWEMQPAFDLDDRHDC